MPEPIIPNFPNIPLTFPKPPADKTKLIVPSIGGVGGKEDLLTSAQKLANSPFKKNNEFNTPYSEVSKEDLARYPNETVFESINTNPSYEDGMRNTQGEGERLWNTTKVFGANAASMFATGLATIPNVIGSVMNNTIGETEFGKEFNMGYDSGVNKSLFDWREDVEKGNRNYKSDWANNHWIQNLIPFLGDGGFQEAVKSGGYGLGVAAEMYVTGGLSKILSVGTGLAKVANGTAKLGGKIASSIYAVDKMENAVKGIADAASTLSRINPALSTEANILRFAEKIPDAFRLYVGAHGEASFEALEGEQRMKMELGKLYEQKNGRKAEGEDLKLIEQVAKKAGQDRYALNLAVLAVPNYLQVGKLMETFPLGRTAKSFWDDVRPNSVIYDAVGKKVGVNTNGFAFKTTSPFWEKGVGKAAKKITEGSVGFLARFPKSTLSISEGFEELGQLYIDELTNSTYKTAFLNKDKSPTLTNWEANKNALSKVFSKEGAESFLMGIIGGVAQQGGTKIFEMLRDDFKGNTQEELAKNQVLAEQLNTLIKDDAPKAFQEYLNSVNTNSIGGSAANKIKSTLATENLSEAQNLVAQGNDQFNYQNLKQQNLFEFISPFVENGKLDILTSYLENLKKYKEEDLGEFFGTNTEISSVHSFVDSAIAKAKELNRVQKDIAIRYINPYKVSPDNEEETTKYVLYENFKKELGHKIWNLSRFNERKSAIESELGQHKDFFKLASESLPEFKTLIDSKLVTLKGEIAAINAIPLSGEAGAFNKNLEALKLEQLEALENAKKNLDIKSEEEYVDAVRATFEAFTQETTDNIPDKLQRAFDLGLLDRSIKQTELIYKALNKQSGFETFIRDREAFFSDITKRKELEKKIEENKDVIESSNLDDDILGGIVAENNSEDIPEVIAKEQIKQVKKDRAEAVKTNEKANFYEYNGKFWRIVIKNKQKFIEELELDGMKKRRGEILPYDETKITLLPSSAKVVAPIKGVNVYFIADGKGYGRNTSTYENGDFTDKNYYPLKTVGGEAFSKLLNEPINIIPTQSFQTLGELNNALGVQPVEAVTQDDWDVEIPQEITKPEFEIHPSILNLRKEGSERGVLIYAEAGSGKSDFVSKYSPNVPVIEADDRIVKYLQQKYPLLSFSIEEIERKRKEVLQKEIQDFKKGLPAASISYNQSLDLLKANSYAAIDRIHQFREGQATSFINLFNSINENYDNQIVVLKKGYIQILTSAGINFAEVEAENVKNLLIDVIKENKNSIVLFSNPNVLSKFTTIDLIVNKKNKATLGNVPVYELGNEYIDSLLRNGIIVTKPVPKIEPTTQPNEVEKGISNVTNLLYEIAPIKAFGTQDPVALVEAYGKALVNWELPQIPTFGFDNRDNRKLAREWFSVLFKQHQISLINKLRIKFPDNWKSVLAENVEIIREDGGSNASLGNGLKQNGNVQRWTFVINKDFVQSILGREYPTDFPFVLHSIKGENGVTHNGTSIIDLTFQQVKDLGINGNIIEQKQWDNFVAKYKTTIGLLNEGRKFSEVFDLEHEVYGFFTKNSPFTSTDYEDVGKEYVYNTYEYNGKNYIVYVINPTDGFSEQSVVYLLDENYSPITVDEETENSIRDEIAANSNEVINHQGRQLVSTRMDNGKKLFTSVPLKQKDFADINSVIDFLKANENSTDTEITTKGIYISIQGYRADGGLRYNPTDKEKSKYKFSVKLVPYQGGESTTVNFHIDKNTKDFQGDVVKKLKEQASKKLDDFTKDNKVELLESLTDKNTSGDDLTTLPYLVANVHPVQYNVDRWKLIPKTNIVKPTPATQTIPVAQVVEEIEFNAENTEEEIAPYIPVTEDLKPTETKEETIEQKVFNLLKNPKENYVILTELPFYGISNLSKLIGHPVGSKVYENVIKMQGTGKDITNLKNLIRKNLNYMEGVITSVPTTRIEDNNITQRVNNILASCF